VNQDVWLAALARELYRRGVDPDLAQHVLASAAAHLRDSGEPPGAVVGPPAQYAPAVAGSLGWERPPGRAAGAVRLEVRGVTKRYGRRLVLNGVNLTVRSGEVVAVVGANGCGKSTLLRICAGLASPDRGTVRVHGTLGYCPQDGGTVDLLTPDDHFVLIGAGRGMARPSARRLGRAYAARLDWTDIDRSPARELSGGTRQKLNLVMAELGDPDVLLLDEPYQGFDRGSYVDFWREVWRWRDAGKAIVVVTHLLSHPDRVDAVLDLTPAPAVAA
jgi:ABC-type multidrug transport system ATPase subunit